MNFCFHKGKRKNEENGDKTKLRKIEIQIQKKYSKRTTVFGK